MRRNLRTDTQKTRQSLLTAAAEVFAEKGYWAATNADICHKAGVNTAAVNYHFGGKDSLYVKAWKHAFELSLQAHPLDGGVAPDAPVEDRLRGRILALIKRFADPNTYDVDIVTKEISNPTGLLGKVVHEAMNLPAQGIRSIVLELLGEHATEPRVQLCVRSIMTQCIDPKLRPSISNKAFSGPPGGMPFDVEELADHITQFSLCGIRGVR